MKYTMMDDNTQQEHFNMGLLTLLSVHIIGLLITQSASAIPITCTQTNSTFTYCTTQHAKVHMCVQEPEALKLTAFLHYRSLWVRLLQFDSI